MDTLSLENEFLRVQILPSNGGKIVSLRSVRTGAEFLLPPLKAYNGVAAFAEFTESDGGGFDECLPSVASCESIAGLPAVSDHGDLWRQPWHVENQNGTIVLHADATSRPLRLTRTASLEGASLLLDYKLVNLSDKPTAWLWSAHPLLRVSPGDHILLPEHVKKVSVEYSAGSFFEKGSSIGWPTAQSPSGDTSDLSIVGKRDGVTAHKVFARIEGSGWAALYRRELSQGIVVRFDTGALPFLGLWVCSGAWPDGEVEKQYTVALEPTTSNTDSLETASNNGTVQILESRGQSQWRLEFQLIGASEPIDLDRFRDAAQAICPSR